MAALKQARAHKRTAAHHAAAASRRLLGGRPFGVVVVRLVGVGLANGPALVLPAARHQSIGRWCTFRGARESAPAPANSKCHWQF